MNGPELINIKLFSYSTMSRLIYFNIMLGIGLVDWIVKYFNPEQNAGLWLAGAAGAFVIRLVLPKITLKLSLSGWVGGFIFALLFASSIAKHTWFAGWDLMAVWGMVAMLGDALLQVVAFIIRLVQKLLGYTLEHPGEAFDESLEKVEKVTNVWVRIKTPFMDLLNTILSKKAP